jgi:hypothetical protein
MSIQGIPTSSTLMREPKALVNRTVMHGRGTKSVKSAQPTHQVTVHNHQAVYYTNSFRSVPTNLFRNQGARYSGNIEQKSFTKLKSATLKISVTLTGDANQWGRLAPITHWFDRIEVRSNNGSNHLGIIRNDQLAFNLNMLSNDKLKSVLANGNMKPDFSPQEEWVAGDTLTFFLPLIGSYLDINQYFADVQGDIVLDFVPATSIVSSGSATIDVDCNSNVETENLSNEDEKAHQQYHQQIISSNRVVDFVPVVEFNKTLTANTVATIDLDSVIGKTAGLLLLVKKTGATNTNNDSSQFVSLGDNATLDFITSGGKSILGSGVPLTAQFIQNELWATHFDSDYSKNKSAYFIPFSGDARSTLKGRIDGNLSI